MKPEDEMQFGQWLALLERVRTEARRRNGTDQGVGGVAEDMGSMKLSLGSFAQRLAERKKRGYAGEYKGFVPPIEVAEDGQGSG